MIICFSLETIKAWQHKIGTRDDTDIHFKKYDTFEEIKMFKELIIKSSFLITAFLTLLLMPAFVVAYTIDGTPEAGGSCYQAIANQNDIANAINAASEGDTIRISAGTAIFSSTIVVTKSLHIIGAGIGATTIQDNSIPDGTWHLTGSGLVRLSGFTLTGNVGSWNGGVRIKGDNKRIDNIRFNQTGGRHPVSAWGNLSNVVIDHCIFEAGGRGINIYGSSSYWSNPSQYAPGTLFGIYIEDCIFNKGGVEVVDLNSGGAYVVRHSTINNGGNLAVHGADSGKRSGGYIEVYNNNFINSGENKDMCVIFRGGSAIIYNNSISGSYNSAFKVQYWRSCYGAGSEYLPFHPDNQSRCEDNSSDPLDGDYSTVNNGWPCKDQPGTGPNHSNQPMYQWNNTWDQGTPRFALHNVGGCSNPSIYDHVKEGRDYFNNTPKPEYTALTYPHPLISGDSIIHSSPNDPSVLRVIE
jgi:hypothetical protein